MVHYVTEKDKAAGKESDDPLSPVTVTSGPSPRDSVPPRYMCLKCGKKYKWKGSLRNHVRLECGKEPQFHCHMCPHKTYQKGNLIRHLALFHKLTVQTDSLQTLTQKMGDYFFTHVVYVINCFEILITGLHSIEYTILWESVQCRVLLEVDIFLYIFLVCNPY